MAKATKDAAQQLALSAGSRSLLKQLKPKGTSDGLLDERNLSDSSSRDEHAGDKFDEEGSDGDSETSSGSLVDNLDRNTATPSPFRSMLGGGGSSGALALKDRLRKLGSSTSGGRVQGFGRGNVLRRRKSGSRPRLQHADSISSSEGTKDNSGANGVLGDDMMSPASSNGKGFMSSSREVTTSSDENDYDDENDEEEGLDSPSTGRRGVLGDRDVSKAKHLPTAGKSNPPASQLRNRLLRLTRPRSRRLPAPHLSSSSDSSTTTIIGGEGEERDHQELASSPGRSVAAESAEAGLSLIDNRLTKGKLPSDNAPHGGLGRRVQKGDSHNNRGLPGMTQGAGITTAGSDNRAEPLRERQKRALLSWRGLISGWGRLDETGEHDLAAVSGVGRSAAGRMENAVYGWFGGVIGRAWPGVGLALRPVVGNEKTHAWFKPHKVAREDDVVSVRVIATDALPEDSRITRPMIIVHIVDSSTGRYLARTPPPKEWASSAHATENGGDRSALRPERLEHKQANEVGGAREQVERPERPERLRQRQPRRIRAGEDGVAAKTEPVEVIAGGATTTFEERTVWDLTTNGGPETGRACGSVPPVATKPWMMTMTSSTPVWEETLVFAESYRRLLAPETLVLFELVDFAAALSCKEARKGGGLSKIAWAFLRPLGARGECNVGVRNGDHSPSAHPSKEYKGNDSNCARISRLQLFKHQPLSVMSKWQARQRGFPRLGPPAAPEVPDVFLQFLLLKRTRYPATLTVSVGPTPRSKPVRVERRPMTSHEREAHKLSYEDLAAMHQKSREDRANNEAAGILPAGAGGNPGGAGGGGGGGATTASASAVARSRRLRAKNEPCALPNRLLHRVYAGQNGAITLAFSGSGALLAAACCDDPLPGRFPIRLIDSETGRCRFELKGHASMVYSLVWSPGDSFLLSASADGTAKIWCISPASDATVGGAPASAEGLSLTSRRGGKDELPRLACVLQHAPPCFVYTAVFQPAEVLDRTRGATVALDHHPSFEASECALVVTGAYDRRLRLWDVASATVAAAGGRAKMLGTLSSKTVHESHVNAIVYDAKNSRLYSGDGSGVIVVWRRGGGGKGGVEDYSVLRKVQHTDLVGKAITSLSLAPRLRRGQLLVQAHGNTLRLLDLGTYQLVNPGFAGGATAESLVRASFSPDGRFVVSGSEKGQVRVWEAQEGKRVRTPLQALGTACCLRDVAWHPHQHVLALAGYGQDAPVLLYCGEARADNKHNRGEEEACVSSTAMAEQAAREQQESAEEHRRRLENRQRLRELRIKRLRAKALGLVDGPLTVATANGPGEDSSSGRPESGVAAALAALTAGGQKQKEGGMATTPAAPP